MGLRQRLRNRKRCFDPTFLLVGEDLFAPIEVLADGTLPSVEPASVGMIEIEVGGAIIRVPLNTDAARVAELALALQVQ